MYWMRVHVDTCRAQMFDVFRENRQEGGWLAVIVSPCPLPCQERNTERWFLRLSMLRFLLGSVWQNLPLFVLAVSSTSYNGPAFFCMLYHHQNAYVLARRARDVVAFSSILHGFIGQIESCITLHMRLAAWRKRLRFAINERRAHVSTATSLQRWM